MNHLRGPDPVPTRQLRSAHGTTSVASRRVLLGAPCALLCGILWATGCTGADLFTQGKPEFRPDRVALSGRLCTEDTASTQFPAKILFVTDQSTDMFAADPNGLRFAPPPLAPPGSIGSIRARVGALPHVALGFIGFSAVAKALPAPEGQRFYRPSDPEVDAALVQLGAPPESQERDLRAALNAAEGFILNDINLSAPGEVLRTRYIVSILMAGPPSPAVGLDTLAEQVRRMAEAIYRRGALDFRVNANMLHYGPRTIDLASSGNFNCYAQQAADPACACPGGSSEYCAVYCDVATAPLDWEARLQSARRALEAVSFASGGVFREYSCPPDIDFNIGVASSNIDLVRKDIVAFNQSAHLAANGLLEDSDADGIPDVDEMSAAMDTDPAHWDTDGDGIGDQVEQRLFPSQDPTVFDRPPSCDDVSDLDYDLLNDCEEGLIQSSRTISDTDGDGMPDFLEFRGGTVPTSAEDRLLDFDGDGVPNALEVQQHTNPRANDVHLRGQNGYRYDVFSLGRQVLPAMENPPELRGIVFRRGSPQIAPGPSWLRWDPCNRTLEWSDARYPNGPQSFEPDPAAITETGLYTLTATAYNGQQIWADIFVVVEQMPPCTADPPVVARPLLTTPERQCYDVTISNIGLAHTQPATTSGGLTPEGYNSIVVYFTQGPQHRLAAPGIAKVAEFGVVFRCANRNELDSCERSSPAVIELADSNFWP